MYTATTARPHRPLRAIGRIIEAGAVITGLPAFLIAAVGWPLPHGTPTWTEVQRAYQIRNIPDRLITGTLACAGWIIWALLVLTLISGLTARIRLTPFRPPRLLPATLHRLVTRWIGTGALIATLATRPAVASVPPARDAIALVTRTTDAWTPTTLPAATTRKPTQTTTAIRVVPARTYVTGANETYWDIAEATLGDGSRWREILDANPELGQVDLVPEGTTLAIPAGHDITVEAGDNLWNLAKHELTDAHGERPTNAEIVPYWRDVIDANADELRSGDPDLIYPGETITLPAIAGDLRLDTQPAPAEAAPDPDVPSTTSPPSPSTNPVTTPERSTTSGAVPAAVAAATPTVDLDNVEPDDFEPFDMPWLYGLAITGVAASVILAAWHRQRRRRIRAHRPGDPLPTLTDNDRDLITQLRGIATDQRLAAIDTALRLLAATNPDGKAAPAVTIARAGKHAVELLLDNRADPTPPNFVRLDQHTIVVNPGIDDATITELIGGRTNPAPGFVTIGTDDVGDVLVDLERITALTIEASDDAATASIVTALLVQLACQPWAGNVEVHTLGTPVTIDPEQRITIHDTAASLLDAAEAHLQAQADTTVQRGTHAERISTNAPIGLLVAVIGPGHPDAATALANAARQTGSALALISCDPIPATAWRLVVTDQRATLEPAGLTVDNRNFRASAVDPEANERLVQTFGPPAMSNTVVGDVRSDSTEPAASDSTGGDDPDEVEQPAELGIGMRYAQLPLLVAPDSDLDELPMASRIERIMQPKQIELVLLDGAPRLEGIAWDRKKAPRADEIVTFLVLNGPSTLQQVAAALWPDHTRPGNTASQTISKTRALLGHDENGEARLRVGKRATPYEIHDIGCDWLRFEQLTQLAQTSPADDEPGLLTAALALVRRAPFEATRVRSFDWASDHCFDSRMRVQIGAASDRLRDLADGTTREWAANIRSIVAA
jgi:hypothetical protein